MPSSQHPTRLFPGCPEISPFPALALLCPVKGLHQSQATLGSTSPSLLVTAGSLRISSTVAPAAAVRGSECRFRRMWTETFGYMPRVVCVKCGQATCVCLLQAHAYKHTVCPCVCTHAHTAPLHAWPSCVWCVLLCHLSVFGKFIRRQAVPRRNRVNRGFTSSRSSVGVCRALPCPPECPFPEMRVGLPS